MGGTGKIGVLRGNVAFILQDMRTTVAPPPSPAAPTAITVTGKPAHPRLQAALAYIDNHLGDPLPLALLADLAQLSVGRFVTVFRLTLGLTPHRYISLKRVHRAQSLLRQGHAPAHIAHECGFYDQSHLTRSLKSLCGMTPRQFQSAAASPPADPGRPPLPRFRSSAETAARWDSAS